MITKSQLRQHRYIRHAKLSVSQLKLHQLFVRYIL